jgi:hypothetical protein
MWRNGLAVLAGFWLFSCAFFVPISPAAAVIAGGVGLVAAGLAVAAIAQPAARKPLAFIGLGVALSSWFFALDGGVLVAANAVVTGLVLYIAALFPYAKPVAEAVAAPATGVVRTAAKARLAPGRVGAPARSAA